VTETLKHAGAALIADGVVHTAASADAPGPPVPGAAQAAST
jgi:hypothetical protein